MTRRPRPRPGEKKSKETQEPQFAGGGANDFSSKIMRQAAEVAPVVSAEIDISLLPKIELPSLEGVEVRVPALPPVTEEEVMARFEMIYYDTCVERTLRELGEPVQLGDEILIDLIAYTGGKIVPFNSHENYRLRLEEDSVHPGFGTALAGAPVGETKVISLDLPQGEGALPTEQAKLVFVVDLKKAAALTFPPAEDPATLKQLGMGDTINDVYGEIAATLGEERASLMLSQGIALTLETLADKVEVEVPQEHVEAEIRSQWSKTEGRFLMEKGLSRQDMDEALEGWLQDEDTQNTARQRLKIAMVVLAYAAQETEELSTEEVSTFFEELAEDNGIDIVKWRAYLAENEAEQEALLNQYLYLRTVTHLVSEIPIHYEEN